MIDVERHAPGLAGVELEGRDAAVHGGPIILQAGRHLDHLGLDVLGDVEQRLGLEVLPGETGQRAADRDVEGRRPGNAGAGRRLAARGQPQAARPEAMRQHGRAAAASGRRAADPPTG